MQAEKKVVESKKNSKSKFRYLIWVILFLLLIILLIPFILHLRPVQNWLVDKTAKSISQKTDAKVEVGEVDFSDQGRSRVMRMNAGLLRVYADRKTGRFLGAEMVGPRAEHLGHLLAWSHQQGLTLETMLAMPFYHPVVEEGLRTALRSAAAQL